MTIVDRGVSNAAKEIKKIRCKLKEWGFKVKTILTPLHRPASSDAQLVQRLNYGVYFEPMGHFKRVSGY